MIFPESDLRGAGKKVGVRAAEANCFSGSLPDIPRQWMIFSTPANALSG